MSMFSKKKNEENYRLEFEFFGKLRRRIPFFLALHLSVRRFQMFLERLSFVKTLATFGISYATDPLLPNMTKIVCLR